MTTHLISAVQTRNVAVQEEIRLPPLPLPLPKIPTLPQLLTVVHLWLRYAKHLTKFVFLLLLVEPVPMHQQLQLPPPHQLLRQYPQLDQIMRMIAMLYKVVGQDLLVYSNMNRIPGISAVRLVKEKNLVTPILCQGIPVK